MIHGPLRIRITENIVWYDIYKEISTQRLRNNDVLDYLLDDLASAGLGLKDIKNYIWIVNCGWEGHDAREIENFRLLLLKNGLPETYFGAVFIAYEDLKKLAYPAICLVDRMIYLGNWYNGLVAQNVDWQTVPMTAKFTVLMRRASESRCYLAKQLLDKFNTRDMIMTLGTSPWQDSDNFKDIIKPYAYPIVVDHVVSEHPFNLIPNHEIFYQAPVQLVVESSNEIDSLSWNSIFITEKSFKALSWYQFPVWFAVPGLVGKLKNMGFDLFDDIIDHGYDIEPNPWIRMTKVIIEIEKLYNKDTNKLRQKLWPRLESNAAIVNKIHINARKTYKTQTNRLTDELQQFYKSDRSTPAL